MEGPSEWGSRKEDGQFLVDCDVSQIPAGLEMSSQVPHSMYMRGSDRGWMAIWYTLVLPGWAHLSSLL